MAIFGAIHTAATGLYVNRKWMDAVSDNISNMNNGVAPSQAAFQERFIQVEAAEYGQVGGGARVAGVRFGDAEGKLVYEPTNPLNENGMVRYPSIDLASQMTNMIMAQRGYQANIAVVERARAAYEQALTIGK